MRVPVLDAKMRPLMPTSSVRARLLLDRGKASAYRNKIGIFCIILKRSVIPNNQRLVLGIDPGSSFEGFSVVGTKKTVLNIMVEAPIHVKKAVEQRRELRRARRHRNCWRRPARFQNRHRNKNSLPPSTHARWNAKFRILEHLTGILPVSDVVVEDIKATSWKGSWKRNRNFSPLETGKAWFYKEITAKGLDLTTRQGHETKELREKYGLRKTRQKSKQDFSSHAVDSWVLAASVSGAMRPTEKGILYLSPVRLHRRQLHRLQPEVGGTRKPYGGTRSLRFTRGTLVTHPEFGLTYIGGTMKDRVSLHDYQSGKRVTQDAKLSGLQILTRIAWRTQYLGGEGRASSTA